jgi:hypothetical protein
MDIDLASARTRQRLNPRYRRLQVCATLLRILCARSHPGLRLRTCPGVFVSDAHARLASSRSSKHTNCDANDPGEPDRQEAGCLPKRASSMLLGTQNQPEMTTRRRSPNLASADPRWGQVLHFQRESNGWLQGDCRKNAPPSPPVGILDATVRFPAFYEATKRNPHTAQVPVA